MGYLRRSIVNRLTLTKEAIKIVLEDSVLTSVFARNGYPAERLAVGLELEENARGLHSKQQLALGNRIQATKLVESLSAVVHTRFRDDRRVAQVALGGTPEVFEGLRLSGQIETRREELVRQAQHFYQEIQALPDILDMLGVYNLTVDVFNNRLQHVEALADAMQTQQHLRGEATVTTQRRREAMDTLDDWTVEFLSTARNVLRKDPKQLNKLGLPIR